MYTNVANYLHIDCDTLIYWLAWSFPTNAVSFRVHIHFAETWHINEYRQRHSCVKNPIFGTLTSKLKENIFTEYIK